MKAGSLLACAAAVCVGVSSARAAVYGGPTYNAATSSGFLDPSALFAPGMTAGDGVAVGAATKYTAGTAVGRRAVRWSAAGSTTVELGNLGTVNGSTTSVAYAVNAAGTAVGYANKAQAGANLGARAVRWAAPGTAATELGNLGTNYGGFTSCTALAVNAAGTTFGYANKYDTAGTYVGYRAVRWNAGGTAATELGSLGTTSLGLTSGMVYAVNDGGTAVGSVQKYVNGGDRGERAVRWDAGGTAATELGNLGVNPNGVSNNRPNAINAAGAAVGYSEKYDAGGAYFGLRAVRWDAGGTAVTELDGLGVGNDGFTNSTAYSINAAGTAVGLATRYVDGTSVGNRAVRWDAGGTAATQLGDLGTSGSGSTTTVAYAINAGGTSVGYATKYASGTSAGNHAVAWGTDRVALDLNRLLSPAEAESWTLNSAHGISATNWITGIGTYDPDATGPLAAYQRAFLIKLAFAGDANADDKVDFNDFLVLQTSFGSTPTATALPPADFNYDGVVDFNDFLILQTRFGTSLSGNAVAVTATQTAAVSAFGVANAVPEPATLGLAGLVGVVLRRRRR